MAVAIIALHDAVLQYLLQDCLCADSAMDLGNAKLAHAACWASCLTLP